MTLRKKWKQKKIPIILSEKEISEKEKKEKEKEREKEKENEKRKKKKRMREKKRRKRPRVSWLGKTERRQVQAKGRWCHIHWYQQ